MKSQNRTAFLSTSYTHCLWYNGLVFSFGAKQIKPFIRQSFYRNCLLMTSSFETIVFSNLIMSFCLAFQKRSLTQSENWQPLTAKSLNLSEKWKKRVIFNALSEVIFEWIGNQLLENQKPGNQECMKTMREERRRLNRFKSGLSGHIGGKLLFLISFFVVGLNYLSIKKLFW